MPKLTNEHKETLRQALAADQAIANELAKRMDRQLAEYLNAVPDDAPRAFRRSVGRLELIEATTVAMLAALSDEARTMWKWLVEAAPLDFSKAWVQDRVIEVFGQGPSAVAVLTVASQPITRFEALFAGTPAPIKGVEVVTRTYIGPLDQMEMSAIINGKNNRPDEEAQALAAVAAVVEV